MAGDKSIALTSNGGNAPAINPTTNHGAVDLDRRHGER